MPLPFRNSAKAVIIKDSQLLTVKCRDRLGLYYLLPGGGQEQGETLHETLTREVKEEAGVDIKIGELKFIREYIGKNHEFAEHDSGTHQVEFMFLCEIRGDCEPKNGPVPDEGQLGVEWIELDKLMEYRFYPKALRERLMDLDNQDEVYLGDVN